MQNQIAAHGGNLINLYLSEDSLDREKLAAGDMPEWHLTPIQLCDIELLLNGGFSPLQGFMSQADYDGVTNNMRLEDGTLWPMPIVLDVPEDFAASLNKGDSIALRTPEEALVATLEISDIWTPDKALECEKIYGTKDKNHPGVKYLLENSGNVYIGGKLKGIEPPVHYDFRQYRHSPESLRAEFTQRRWRKIIAFHTRSPMHRAQTEVATNAAISNEANLVIHPAIGITKPGEPDPYTRVKCYEAVVNRLPQPTTMLSLLPLAMRMAGPREALWHAIIRRNFGFTHIIIGKDHGSSGNDSTNLFYEPYAAQAFVKEHETEIGIEVIPVDHRVYVQERAEFLPLKDVGDDQTTKTLHRDELHRRLWEDLEIPDWFSYPEVITALKRAYIPRHVQGLTIFFTGLSGSGKSTVANALAVRMLEQNKRTVSLLDGDHIRKSLSSELGFSKEHRDINILRIGYVASEIAKAGGIAICAPIAPYEKTREAIRDLLHEKGAGFVEIHISTPLETCEARDRKGLYAMARKGLIKEFTGISDPYEIPENPDLRIDTTETSPQEAVNTILLKLEHLGYLR